MKFLVYPFRLLLILSLLSVLFLHRDFQKKTFHLNITGEPEEGEAESEREAEFKEARLKHEFEMLRNPLTNTIPANIRELELKVANSIPDRNSLFNYRVSASQVQNNYVSIGPD